ncbi:MAG: hypothetical protein J1E62_00145 [Lachnospiraceae bacterium]|nr:hypothetical protein [Lachnospiraceae bacterium]
MNKAKLKNELKRALNRHMQDVGESMSSRRVEGMWTRTEDRAMPVKAAILIDNELDNVIFHEMATFVKDVLQGDSNYRKMKFLTHLWKRQKIEKKPLGKIDFIRVVQLQEVLCGLQLDNGSSGDWDDLKEDIDIIRKAPLVLFFTTEEKIEKLADSKFSFPNMIIIYPTDKEGAVLKKIRNIPCLLYSFAEQSAE